MLKKLLPFFSFSYKRTRKKGKHLTSVEHLIGVAVVCFLSVLSEILFLTPQDILYYLLKFLLLLFASTSVCGHEIAQTDNKTELRQQAKPCWCKYWLVLCHFSSAEGWMRFQTVCEHHGRFLSSLHGFLYFRVKSKEPSRTICFVDAHLLLAYLFYPCTAFRGNLFT